MEQQVHDKSERFKIIYKALLLQITGMELKKYVNTKTCFAILLACI